MAPVTTGFSISICMEKLKMKSCECLLGAYYNFKQIGGTNFQTCIGADNHFPQHIEYSVLMLFESTVKKSGSFRFLKYGTNYVPITTSIRIPTTKSEQHQLSQLFALLYDFPFLCREPGSSSKTLPTVHSY